MTLWLAEFSYTVLTVHWEWRVACHNKQTCGHLTFRFPFSVVLTVRVSVLLVGDSELTKLISSSHCCGFVACVFLTCACLCCTMNM